MGRKKGNAQISPRRRCFSLFQSAFSMPVISPFGNKLKLFVYKSLILKSIRPRKAKPRTFHERNQISSWKVRRLAWMSLDRPTRSIRLLIERLKMVSGTNVDFHMRQTQLLSNSENREHLILLIFVVANHNKFQDTLANLKTTNYNYHFCSRFSYLAPYNNKINVTYW